MLQPTLSVALKAWRFSSTAAEFPNFRFRPGPWTGQSTWMNCVVVTANPENSSAYSRQCATTSFCHDCEELTVRAIILWSVTAAAGGTHCITIPAVQSIVRSWIPPSPPGLRPFSTSSGGAGTCDPSHDAHLHRLVYETLFYSRYGKSQL